MVRQVVKMAVQDGFSGPGIINNKKSLKKKTGGDLTLGPYNGAG